MKFLVLILVLVCASAALAANPVISDNFSGQLIIIDKNRDRTENTTGAQYVDFVNKRERFDIVRRNTLIKTVILYATKFRYEIIGTECFKQPLFNDTMVGPWDWLSNASNLGSCHGIYQNAPGNLYGFKNTNDEFATCIADDNTTPYWVENVRNTDDFTMIFTSFNPTVPAASFFTVPANC